MRTLTAFTIALAIYVAALWVFVPPFAYGDHLQHGVLPMEWKDYRSEPLCSSINEVAYKAFHYGYRLTDDKIPGFVVFHHPTSNNYTIVAVDVAKDRACVIGAGNPPEDAFLPNEN